MATSCAIIAKLAERYKAIFCTFDGFPEKVGRRLMEHYPDAESIARLFALGHIVALYERTEPTGQHTREKPEKGVTIALHRECGEPFEPALEAPTVAELTAQFSFPYVYLWEGAWKVAPWTKSGDLVFRSVEEAIAENV